MGKCGSMPAAITLDSVVDLPIGGVKQSSAGCCPSIGGEQGGSGYDWCVNKRGFAFPKNGEFRFTLGAGCGLCSDIGGGYGCGCSGGDAIGGQLPAITRIGFNADRTKCCLDNSGAPIQGGLTCDPAYRGPNTVGCQSVIQTYCDNPNTFFSPICKQWILNQNSAVRNTLANKHCANTSDPWCACFNSKLPAEWVGDPIKTALFRCLDPNCQGGSNPKALKPYGMTCPTSYVECQQADIQLKLQNAGIPQTTIANNCGNINLGGGSSAPAPANTPSPPSNTGKSNTTIIVVVVVVIVLLLIIAIAAAMLMKKKPATK